MQAFAEGLYASAAGRSSYFEMKAQRDGQEGRQRQQVVLGALLEPGGGGGADGFQRQQINRRETGRHTISLRMSDMDTSKKRLRMQPGTNYGPKLIVKKK